MGRCCLCVCRGARAEPLANENVAGKGLRGPTGSQISHDRITPQAPLVSRVEEAAADMNPADSNYEN